MSFLGGNFLGEIAPAAEPDSGVKNLPQSVSVGPVRSGDGAVIWLIGAVLLGIMLMSNEDGGEE